MVKVNLTTILRYNQIGDKHMRNIGRIIESKLQENNMTQSELGELVGLNQRTISQYVRGNSQPSLETLSKICQLLKIDIYYILELKSYDNSNMVITDKNEIEVLNCYRSLSEEQRKVFDSFIYVLNKNI